MTHDGRRYCPQMTLVKRAILSHTAKSLIGPCRGKLSEAHYPRNKNVSVAGAALVMIAFDPRRPPLYRGQLIEVPLQRHTGETLNVTNQVPIFGVKCLEGSGPDDTVIQALRGDPLIE